MEVGIGTGRRRRVRNCRQSELFRGGERNTNKRNPNRWRKLYIGTNCTRKTES